jgi:predicted phage terminase large subunit-like protein
LGHHPEWEIIAASHTQSLALSFSRYIRDLLRDPAYQAIFGETKLDPDTQAVENWLTTRGGGYLAAGVGTGITGRGAHVAIVDDPVKDMEQADSQVVRDNTWEWYLSTLYTRLAPGGGVLGILTLWNEDDWGGRIIMQNELEDGDKFEIVRYPAINDQGDEYLLADDTIVQLPPDATPPEGAELIRPMNSALHPARYDFDYLTRIKNAYYATGQQRIWSALYQQNPTPGDGIFFTRDMFRYGKFERRAEWSVYQAWDFAITEKNVSDWTVCATIAQTTDDDIIVLDILRFRTADGVGLVDTMFDMYERWRPEAIGVEDGQIWKSLTTLFQRRGKERRLYPSIDVLVPLTDKMVRAGPLRGRMQMGKVYFQHGAPWLKDLESELTAFPAGKNDDQCDGLSWAVRQALQHAAPRAPASRQRVTSWKDKLRGLSSVDVGHMAA